MTSSRCYRHCVTAKPLTWAPWRISKYQPEPVPPEPHHAMVDVDPSPKQVFNVPQGCKAFIHHITTSRITSGELLKQQEMGSRRFSPDLRLIKELLIAGRASATLV
jgi:hypothetical protein